MALSADSRQAIKNCSVPQQPLRKQRLVEVGSSREKQVTSGGEREARSTSANRSQWSADRYRLPCHSRPQKSEPCSLKMAGIKLEILMLPVKGMVLLF
ncbi:hypothetical protein NDU88_002775 [Pleurodeles waltl]|uniref:Uncharacterized protein n=1 Tax=Pleurodeles waltl TaxID=8319 RepID=A0AAV7NER8_PLEWA|nr:hypothetical protein NDU88_002775 [Pleurodeles waltl]